MEFSLFSRPKVQDAVMNLRQRWAVQAAMMVPLCLFAAVLANRYGMRGYTEYSEGLYSGGYRVLLGDVPFRDFFSEEGILQSYSLALWFKVFGTDWSAFVAYAAFLNALFAGLVFVLCGRVLGLSTFAALVYGLGSAVVFSPPWGVPHPSKDGEFYILVALTLQAWAAGRNRSARGVFLCQFTMVLCGMAVLACKGNPGAFYTPFCLMLFLMVERRVRQNALLGLGAGLATLAAFGLVLELMRPGTVATMFYYFIELPRSVAASRTGTAAGDIYVVFAAFHMGSPVLVFAQALGMAIPFVWWVRRDRIRTREAAVALVVGVAAFAMTFLYFRFSAEPKEGGIPLVFVAIAGFHRILAMAATGRDGDRSDSLAVAAPILAFTILMAMHFNMTFNAMRLVTEQRFDLSRRLSAGTSGVPGLDGLEWIARPEFPEELDMIRDVVSHLRETDGNVVLSGFSPNLYVLGRKPPVEASLWGLAGVTIPPPGTSQFERLAGVFLDNMKRRHVTRAIVRNWEHRRAALPAEMVCGVAAHKHFTEVTLCPGYERLGAQAVEKLIQ